MGNGIGCKYCDKGKWVFFVSANLGVRGGCGRERVGGQELIDFGKGEDLQGAVGKVLEEGVDDRADGGAGGEDIVDEEKGGIGGNVRGFGRGGCFGRGGVGPGGQGFGGDGVDVF